jgi:ferredoxin-nitrite reductase
MHCIQVRTRVTSSRSVRACAIAQPVDMETSGLKHLSAKARETATQKKINPFEKVKNKKCGSRMWTEVHELSAMLKAGTHTFADLDLDDVDIRLKWAGLFHRKKRTPGKFMMRLKVSVMTFLFHP